MQPSTGDAVEVNILGQTYILRTSDGEAQTVRQAAVRVDQEMRTIRDQGKIKARERSAVLAAINLAFELQQRPSTPAIEPTPITAQPAEAVASEAASTTPAETPDVPSHNTIEQQQRLHALLERLDDALKQTPSAA